MSLPEMVIRYRHDEGDTCTGEILLRWEDGSFPAQQLHAIDRIGFNRMMGTVSEELNKHKVSKLIMERTDRGGLKPFVFDNPTVELLRSDPVSVIRLMNIPPIHIDLRKEKPAPLTPIFVAGHDALANGFGDEVYARVRGTGGTAELECPCCGLWSTVDTEFVFNCKKKCKLTMPVRFTEKWAVVKVEDLLGLKLDRYYLPREWNKSHGWITRADLEALFEQWKKEKMS